MCNLFAPALRSLQLTLALDIWRPLRMKDGVERLRLDYGDYEEDEEDAVALEMWGRLARTSWALISRIEIGVWIGENTWEHVFMDNIEQVVTDIGKLNWHGRIPSLAVVFEWSEVQELEHSEEAFEICMDRGLEVVESLSPEVKMLQWGVSAFGNMFT
jgi:hypothetical protein